MPETTTTPVDTEDFDAAARKQTPPPAPPPSPESSPDALVEGDLLVEDVSIDGMCGVY